jgi:hypothetical protein
VIIEALLRMGVLPGMLVVGSVADGPAESATRGILIFAVGIIVGLACVLAMDFSVRRKMRRDYDIWVAQGCPERRFRERRSEEPVARP